MLATNTCFKLFEGVERESAIGIVREMLADNRSADPYPLILLGVVGTERVRNPE